MPISRKFNANGMLDQDYAATFQELRESMLVRGPKGSRQGWDREWRLHLVENLQRLASQLWSVGVDRIFIAGSFVEDKPRPGDIDGYFEVDGDYYTSGRLEEDLNALEPEVWTWAPEKLRQVDGYPYPLRKLPMWHRYRVELYPHYRSDQLGIINYYGMPDTFPSAFRMSARDGSKKGLIQLMRP